MNTKWACLIILGILLMWSPGLRPAWAQTTVNGEVTAYGYQTTNYALGVANYNGTGYLRSDGTQLVPTTQDKAEETYTLNVAQAVASGDMTSYGEMINKGKGVNASFVQTQTLNLSLDGKFQNCPEEPIYRKYSGTQTLEGHTTPAGGDGELHGYGNQTVKITASCISATLNQQGTSNQGAPSGNSDGSGNGRLILNVETSAYSVADRTGPGVAGTFTQTHSVDVSPQATGTPAGATGSTNVTTSQ
jgi:hypothetical protein